MKSSKLRKHSFSDYSGLGRDVLSDNNSFSTLVRQNSPSPNFDDDFERPHSFSMKNFISNEADVTCVSLGHKSGKVLAVGRQDKKVNLYAVGKQNCIISLAGHSAAVSCVRFNQAEEMICAGSKNGLIKIWDLEAAKILRSLVGHNGAIHSIDFNPSGFYLCSSSAEHHAIKFWDMRRKGCLFTLDGHQSLINDIKFSPDGQWIASGSNDGSLKLWDLRKARVLKNFNNLSSSVSHIQFHPNEFLIAGGTSDRKVYFWDLETFELVSAETDAEHSITCMSFDSKGEYLYLGLVDHLRVIGWEPHRVFDKFPIRWSQVQDISITLNELIGVSTSKNNMAIYVFDLDKIKKDDIHNDVEVAAAFSTNQSIRKSFSKGKSVNLKQKTLLESKLVEESTSSTEIDDESLTTIDNFEDYTNIFRPKKNLSRTPPLNDFSADQDEYESYSSYPSLTNDSECNRTVSSSIENQPPQISEAEDSMTFEVIECQSKDKYVPPQNGLVQKKVAALTAATGTPGAAASKHKPSLSYKVIGRQKSQHDSDSNKVITKIQHSVSEINLSSLKETGHEPNHKKSANSIGSSKSFLKIFNSNQISHSNSNLSTNFNFDQSSMNSETNRHLQSFESKPLLRSTQNSPVNFRHPHPTDSPKDSKKVLQVHDFIPKSYHGNKFNNNNQYNISENEQVQILSDLDSSALVNLEARKTSLQILTAQLNICDISAALSALDPVESLAPTVDVILFLNKRTSRWTLDLAATLLPTVLLLLQSKYESYISLGCESLRIIMHNFFDVIKSNIYSPVGSFGVDIPREERYNKCCKCNEVLLKIQLILNTRGDVPAKFFGQFKHYSEILSKLNP